MVTQKSPKFKKFSLKVQFLFSNVTTKISLLGTINGNDGMAFSIRDIAIEWNKVMGERLGLAIDLNVVPAGTLPKNIEN